MIFEFPFDLIVMARIYPPIPPHPALYRVLFFAFLFLVEVLTLSLLTLSPAVRLSKAAFFIFALMLAVFAVWGLFGFGYPSAPAAFTFNVVSKILAFVVTLSLFLRREPRPVRPIGHVAGTASSLTATTLDTYGHIWPDRDESTGAAVDAVITARTNRDGTAATLSSSGAGQDSFDGQQSK